MTIVRDGSRDLTPVVRLANLAMGVAMLAVLVGAGILVGAGFGGLTDGRVLSGAALLLAGLLVLLAGRFWAVRSVPRE